MKKIKLDSAKLQLQKERVYSLTLPQTEMVLGGKDISRGGDMCNTMHMEPGQNPAPQPMSWAKYGLTCLQLTHCPSGGDRQYCK